MTENELIKIIDKLKKENEIPWIEAKHNLDDIIKIAQTISALSNSASWKDEEYGYFIWGLENKTWKILGTDLDLRNETTFSYKTELIKQIPKMWLLAKLQPSIYFEDFEFVLEGLRIYVLKIKNCGNKPIYFDKIAYIRIDSHNQELLKYPDINKVILNKNKKLDWSAQICEGATVDDLDEEAILKIKKLWVEKTDRQDILKFDTRRLLVDLFETDEILKATLILLGKKSSIEKYGINTEITFHYRNNSKSIRSDDRRDFRRCFALEYDEIWNKIDARNEIFYFQKGLFLDQIKKFNESVIREALLNCIAHRDYETEYASSQITIEQSPDKIEFKNPGQLPTDTDLAKLIQIPSKPRNKKLAEVFQKLRLIEKSGFGIDLIVQKTISEGKGSPEYINFDNHYVFLILNANLQDEAFVRYLYKIAKDEDYTFDAIEVLALEEVLLTGNTKLNQIKENLLKRSFIENSGTGKGSKLILSKKYFELSGDDVNRYLDQKYDKFEHKDKLRKFVCQFGPKDTKEIMNRVKLPISDRTKSRYLNQLVTEKEIVITGKKGKLFIYDKKHDN